MGAVWEILSSALRLAIVFIIGFILFLVALWIFIRIKRWRVRALLRREENDTKLKIDYIIEEGKKANGFQRFNLKHFGSWFSLKKYAEIIIFAIIFNGILIAILIAILTLISKIVDVDLWQLIPLRIYIIIQIGCVIVLGIWFIAFWIHAIKTLIKYARIGPFVICLIISIIIFIIIARNMSYVQIIIMYVVDSI